MHCRIHDGCDVNLQSCARSKSVICLKGDNSSSALVVVRPLTLSMLEGMPQLTKNKSCNPPHLVTKETARKYSRVVTKILVPYDIEDVSRIGMSKSTKYRRYA